ncbi:and other transporter-domain-containing protein [Pseudomassariella vexata]|uniref:And other transporter-domain-containing protein n=1 Tax=Pseudomassariella vexata TaxID=1141098 RepID=A0A1Y2DXP9_9PEZI|nr:and other transporter-domain-containing protein [Pseudomassariella vexata]ORY64041.1 and other transporter-domain-containing protein [Pseudomassariella vexata]
MTTSPLCYLLVNAFASFAFNKTLCCITLSKIALQSDVTSPVSASKFPEFSHFLIQFDHLAHPLAARRTQTPSLVNQGTLGAWSVVLLLSSAKLFKISASNGNRNRLAANIPLRTLRPDQNAQSTSLLAGQRDQSSHDRRSSGSVVDSDSDSWTDTGDIAEQLADEDDPLRTHLADTSPNDELLAGVLKKHPKTKRVQFRRSVSEHSHGQSRLLHSGVVNKEAIEIPDVAPRRISGAERLLASIMPGTGVHGLTGKSLIYFTSIFVSLGVFLFGYDQGVMSGIITGPYFRDYFNHPSHAEIGTMVAILEIGALISSLAVGKVGDVIGRRKTILYGSMIFFVGGLLQTLATNMPMMMLGRIIAGLGVGSLSTIVPVYQSEISPPHSRGKLACIEFSGNIIGYTTSVWVDYFCGFIESNYSWRLPLFMQCVMGALLGFGSLLIVESPRWLLDNDHDEEGIVVIANLYGKGDIHNAKARDEYREIKMNVLLQRMEGERTYSEMFRRYKTRVFIAMSAQALAQLNGINVISYYAPYVFESAGWVGHDAVKMTGINGITYLLSTIPPWYIVDRWGRRIILLTGAVAMAIALSFVSYFIYLDIAMTPTLVVVFVMIYNAAFGYSWGPIPWLYPPEILPLSIRSKGASLSTASNWTFNFLVGEMTPILQEWITWRLYLVHAFFCVVSFVVVYFVYPETCGVRLEEMDSLFGDATTAMGTPSMRSESGSIYRASSPIPSLDLRGRPGAPGLGSEANIPPFDIDPPAINFIDGKPQIRSESGSRGRVGEWLTRMVGRDRGSSSSPAGTGRYAPLDQQEEE